MKKFFLSLFAMMIATVSFAQSTMVATLTHGEDISMFYGANAFVSAVNAATHGDIINLSGGSFSTTTITKAITVRGTGVNEDNPTKFSSGFTINIPADVTERISFEGCQISSVNISGTLTNAYFFRNTIKSIGTSSSSTKLINGMIVNCQVNSISVGGSSTLQVYNSYISSMSIGSPASATIVNCVASGISSFNNSIILNSIFVDNSGYSLKTAYAINTVAVGSSSSTTLSRFASQKDCTTAGMDIFVDSDPMKDLTAEAKVKYLGDDGNPVGMYSGSLPYSLVPSYPRITKMNVANRATADGKLSVEIGVSAAK